MQSSNTLDCPASVHCFAEERCSSHRYSSRIPVSLGCGQGTDDNVHLQGHTSHLFQKKGSKHTPDINKHSQRTNEFSVHAPCAVATCHLTSMVSEVSNLAFLPLCSCWMSGGRVTWRQSQPCPCAGIGSTASTSRSCLCRQVRECVQGTFSHNQT